MDARMEAYNAKMYTSDDSNDTINIPPDLFDISNDTEMTTVTITKNHNKFYEMTLEEQMQLYEEEHYAAEDAAEEAARPTSEWKKAEWKLFLTEIGPEFNTDDKFTATAATTTTTMEEALTINTTINTTGQFTTIIEEEPNQENITTDIVISDSTVCTANTASVPKIIENTTTVHTTNTVHISNTTRDQEYYSMCTTINKESNITTCITTTSGCEATMDAESSTGTIKIFNNNIKSPITTTDTTDTILINETQCVIDTTTVTTPPTAKLQTKTKI